MTWEMLPFLLAGAAAGGFVNGLAGFGTSLFALGWWLQVMAPVEAVALSLVLSVASGVQGVWVVRGAIRRRRLAWFLVPALAGIPVGLALLTRVEPGPLKLAVAGFLIVFAGYFMVRRRLPAVAGETTVMDAATGLAGGVLGALAGLSGALPTMWTSMKDWPKDVRRAVLQPYNVAVLGLSAAALAVAGAYDRDALVRIAVALPVTLLAAQGGLWAFRRLDDTQFRWLVVGLMFASGTVLLAREFA